MSRGLELAIRLRHRPTRLPKEVNAALPVDAARSDPRSSDLRPSDRQWRPRWFVGAGVGVGGCLAFLVIPYDSIASSIVYLVVSMAALAAVTVAAIRMPAGVRLIWWLVWGYVLLTFVGDVVLVGQTQALGQVPRPGSTDVAYLAAYACALVGLVLLVRRVQQGHDTEAWVDTIIVIIALASYIALLVVEPTMRQAAESDDGAALAVTLAYVLLDLVILAGLARLLVGDRRINPAIAILSASFVTTFTADLAQSFLQANSREADSNAWVDTLFLATFVGIAAASWAPGARRFATAVDASVAPITSGRMIGLALGALAVPIMIAVTAWDVPGRQYKLITLGCVLAILLVLWRFQLLLRVAKRQAATLSSLARTDSLTGLPNRRTLDSELDRIEATASTEPFTVAMLDLDLFKTYNDVNGHQAGDLVLVACARAWQAASPVSAVIARYGGEEFVLLLPSVDLESARPLLERLRGAMPGKQTVSIGAAERRPGESPFETMRRADRALYLAKQSGRDRVVLDPPSPSETQ